MILRYDKRIKPPGAESLRVNVSVVLLSLSSPDESSLHYEVEFIMKQRWEDPRLSHDDGTRHNFLNGIHHHADIWKPDIYFIKHGTFKDNLDPSNIALRIHRNGTVLYSMRRHLVLNCEGDLHIFPFDSPMCSFSMESGKLSQIRIAEPILGSPSMCGKSLTVLLPLHCVVA